VRLRRENDMVEARVNRRILGGIAGNGYQSRVAAVRLYACDARREVDMSNVRR
jgi:hypothetical protein